MGPPRGMAREGGAGAPRARRAEVARGRVGPGRPGRPGRRRHGRPRTKRGRRPKPTPPWAGRMGWRGRRAAGRPSWPPGGRTAKLAVGRHGAGPLARPAQLAALVHRAVTDDLALGHAPEVPAVLALAVPLGARHERVAPNPAVLEGDLLEHGDGRVLRALHGAHEVAGLVEALHGAGVEPREAAAERHHAEQAVLEVHPVEVGDLELTAGARARPPRKIAHARVVEVQARYRVGALGVRWLLLDRDGVEVLVELHHAEALGVVDVVADTVAPPSDSARSTARRR